MGYGVVKHTLGKTMIYVRWLAIAHFVFGLVYAITSLVITPDSAGKSLLLRRLSSLSLAHDFPGPFVLLIVLPLAGTLTAFYVWTLNSLNFTLKDLRERKQHAKESMYKKLWWCILLSIMVIFAFFFFNSFSFASASDPDYVPFHWKSRWFVLDGWLNLVYFADVAWIAYVWRPTANNRRFAMSDEIAQVCLSVIILILLVIFGVVSQGPALGSALYLSSRDIRLWKMLTRFCHRTMMAHSRSRIWILAHRMTRTTKRPE